MMKVARPIRAQAAPSRSGFIEANKVHQSLQSHMLADGLPYVCDMSKSSGSRFLDARDGKMYLDFFCGFGSSPLGFNHPKLATEKFLQDSKFAVYNKPSNADLYTFEFEQFVRTFSRVAVPKDMKYSFFIDGGALAVENALKACFDWKVRKNKAKGIKAEVGTKIIHFRHAFHGRTGYTMSLTNTDPIKIMHFPKFDWPRITSPAIQPDIKKTLEDEAKAINEIDEAFNKYGDDIAAIIIETVQCEGGDRYFRKEFLQTLEQKCRQNDCMFIMDEVQTGFFTSGKQWAYQHYDVHPDIISFGKKTQTCGVIAGPRFDEVKDHVFSMSSRINSTFGGNLMDMVRATRVMEIIEEENLGENAAKMGHRWLDGMKKIAEKYPFITNPRGLGLLMAFDMPDGENRAAMMHHLEDHGLLSLKCGPSTIRFRPPLSVTQSEIDESLQKIEDSAKSFKVIKH